MKRNGIVLFFLFASFLGFTQDEGEEPVYLTTNKETEFQGENEQMQLFYCGKCAVLGYNDFIQHQQK